MAKFSLKEDITEMLALIAAFGSFAVLTLLFFKPIPEVNQRLIDILGGLIIGNSLSNAYGFYFGQSKNRTTPPVEPGQTVTNIQTSTITPSIEALTDEDKKEIIKEQKINNI